MEQVPYSTEQMANGTRKSIDPSRLVSYLPVGSPHETDVLTIDTWTKLLVPTTAKELKEYAIVDTGAGDLRYQYQGDATRSFKVSMITSVSADVAATNVEFAMSNGTIGVDQDDLETGIYGKSDQKFAGESLPLIAGGVFTADPLDTIAIWVKVDKAGCKLTFSGMSIVIIEVN